MIHTWNPTLEAPKENSPNWYYNYHSAFTISQLVNNVLISYLELFIKKFQIEDIILRKKEELLSQKIISEGKNILDSDITYIDYDKIYAIAIEESIQEILKEFSTKHLENIHVLACMGIETDFYDDRNINFDIKKVLKTTGKNDWYAIVKGFLNIWEFLFLFSITENTFKKFCNEKGLNKKGFTKSTIPEININYPEVSEAMDNKYGINSHFSENIWNIFTEIRNIYSHTHGVLSEKDKDNIIKYSVFFKESYAKSLFEEGDLGTNLFNQTMMPDPDEYFSEDQMNIGEFFFLTDYELNIFRNFVSGYVYYLSDLNN